MGKKRRAKPSKAMKAGRGRGEPSFWMIAAVICFILLVGFIVKTIYEKTSYSSGPKLSPATVIQPVAAPAAGPLESEVLQVASNFRCACGECGELPLAECTCTTPRGAVEEKAFIRGKLKEGLSAAQVIELVDKKYGHRMT
jgi:cytochrome c-type biogenesis protein CcmH/NrfF